MKSITVHNIDEVLYRRLAEVAADQNLSLNTTIKSTLSDALGVNNKKQRRDLSWLFAKKWTVEDSKSFEEAVADSEKIDAEDWK